MSKRAGLIRFSVVKWIAIPLAVIGVATAASVMFIDYEGGKFFNNGKQIKEELTDLAHVLRARNYAGIDSYFAADFKGFQLGLNALKPVEVRDGIRKIAFGRGGSVTDRASAIDEWHTYLAGFDSIEELGLHIDKFEKWGSKSDLRVSVRFELIGTPHGAKYAGIDRGYFNMSLREGGSKGLEIVSASLISGDRSIGDKPHFTNVAHAAGIDFTNRYYPGFTNQKLKFAMIKYGPAGMTTVDYDNDGFYDIFVPDGVESKLFHNTGDGHFEDVTAKAGLAGLDGVSVGVFADYDNDGFKDIFISRTFKPNQLFHNNHDGTFTDVSNETGTCATLWGWGAKFADFDNDGWLDLFVVNGLRSAGKENYIPVLLNNTITKPGVDFTDVASWPNIANMTWSGYQKKKMFKNLNGQAFKEISAEAGVDNDLDGRGVAIADFDNDGKLDIYQSNADQPSLLYRSVSENVGNWLQFKLTGTKSNRDAIGARITVKAAGLTQIREIDGGNGYAGQSMKRAHFGIGSATKIDSVEVKWPTGVVEKIQGVALNKMNKIVEGKGLQQ